MNEWNARFGERVRAARLEAGLLQEDVARRVGVERSTVANIEGGRASTSAHRVVAIAEALRVDPGWLLTGRHDETATERLRQLRTATDEVLADMMARLTEGMAVVSSVPDPNPGEG